MFGTLDQIREEFAAQFEAEGEQFVYRAGVQGAPVRVSGEELETFQSDFARRLNIGAWIMAPAFILLVVGAIVGGVVIGVPDAIIVPAGVAALFALMGPAYWWTWKAPARALERRPAIGRPLSREEVRRRKLGRMSYERLAATGVAILWLIYQGCFDSDLPTGWKRAVLAASAAGLLGIVAQAVRKWRHDAAA